MNPSPLKIVCFDAGGVLVRICRSWREGCKAAGIEYRWSDEAEAGEPERKRLSDAYQRGEIECEAFFAGMAETSAGLCTPEDVRAVHDAWILGEYPGVRELVAQLNRTDGLTTGLLSNTSARHWEGDWMWGGRGVSAVGSITHPHASHLLGMLKPGGDIYKAFEHNTGFAGSDILFFDDLPENVEAARASGWRAEVIDFTGDSTAQIGVFLAAHGLDFPVSGRRC